ncbi:MAG: cytochrome c-type biogenesis protein CcmH [Caldimonas sp.]
MPESVLKAILAGALALAALAAGAREALPEAADPAFEARMTRITAELRCLVCQNQTIADSNAALAVDAATLPAAAAPAAHAAAVATAGAGRG